MIFKINLRQKLYWGKDFYVADGLKSRPTVEHAIDLLQKHNKHWTLKETWDFTSNWDEIMQTWKPVERY